MTANLPPPKDHPHYAEWLAMYRIAIEARETYFALKAQLPDGDPELAEIAATASAAEAEYLALCAEIAP